MCSEHEVHTKPVFIGPTTVILLLSMTVCAARDAWCWHSVHLVGPILVWQSHFPMVRLKYLDTIRGHTSAQIPALFHHLGCHYHAVQSCVNLSWDTCCAQGAVAWQHCGCADECLAFLRRLDLPAGLRCQQQQQTTWQRRCRGKHSHACLSHRADWQRSA